MTPGSLPAFSKEREREAMAIAPRIDLNCDAGESFGVWRLGDDDALFEVVTSANIACGFHAGDPSTIEAAIRKAASRGLAIGAHPSYPDLVGFGRRTIRMRPDEVESAVVYQIGALDAIARANGVRLAHVKPHGALYNDASRDRALADAIASAVRRCTSARLVGLAGSALIDSGHAVGVPTAGEAFCDRTYERDGSLTPRSSPGSVISDPAAAAGQAIDIVLRRRVRAVDGSDLPVDAQTICVHGDTPGAAEVARVVRSSLESAGVRVLALEES
jgi:UPF0271 protein